MKITLTNQYVLNHISLSDGACNAMKLLEERTPNGHFGRKKTKQKTRYSQRYHPHKNDRWYTGTKERTHTTS